MDNHLVHTDQSLSRNHRMLQGDLNLLQVDNEAPLDHRLAGRN